MVRKLPGAPEEDWEKVAAETTPLGAVKRPSGARPNPRRLPLNRAQREALKDAQEDKRLPPPPQMAAVPLTIISNTAARLAGCTQDFERGRLKELSEGKVPYTAMLDLHGWFEGEAYLHLMNWLQEASHEGERCVLVICGKGQGYGANRDMGILKAQLAGWLANHPAVLAFHTAIPAHGGAGAVYVFLRRWR